MQIEIIGNNYCSKALYNMLSACNSDIIFTLKEFDNLQTEMDFVAANDISLIIDTQFGNVVNSIEMLQIPSFLGSVFQAKKLVYKNKIKTSKFSLIEKPFNSTDFLSKFFLPVVIYPDFTCSSNAAFIAETQKKFIEHVEFLFENDNKKILIEEYVHGIEFTKYIAMDGENIINLFETLNYFDEIAVSGTNFISQNVKNKIENEIIPKILDGFAEEAGAFKGIFGVSFIINKNEQIYFSRFKPFFSDLDIHIAFKVFKNNFKNLLISCANGTLKDNYKNFEPIPKCIFSAEAQTDNKITTLEANTLAGVCFLAETAGIDPNLIDEAVKFWKN